VHEWVTVRILCAYVYYSFTDGCAVYQQVKKALHHPNPPPPPTHTHTTSINTGAIVGHGFQFRRQHCKLLSCIKYSHKTRQTHIKEFEPFYRFNWRKNNATATRLESLRFAEIMSLYLSICQNISRNNGKVKKNANSYIGQLFSDKSEFSVF
jgi:hypothetical protein